MKLYGLIGKTLKHSFSKKYFADKFESDQIANSEYSLFELPTIEHFTNLIQQNESLAGLNVTIPYKKKVMPFLDELDENAEAIDAVNTIKFLPNGKLKGYNTDCIGFKNSLTHWNLTHKRALILGTGGASNAIKKVLTDLHIPYQLVSRRNTTKSISYIELAEDHSWIASHQLIINTTPLGTFPNLEEKPSLPYNRLSKDHLLFDLVYNPEVTAFMQEGLNVGCQVKNGYDMLVGQAEAAWEIWNE